MTSPDLEMYLTFECLGNFEPDDMTAQLGVEPTETFRQGDVVGTGHSSRVHGWSGWHLNTDSTIGDSIDSHLMWLLGKLEPKAVELTALRDEEAQMRVTCFWSSSGTGGGPWITAEAMRRLSDLGLDLVISFYTSD